jgi:hypothetical protein
VRIDVGRQRKIRKERTIWIVWVMADSVPLASGAEAEAEAAEK